MIDWNPFLLALPAAAVAYLGYRRSQRVDEISAQSGVASNERAGTEQAFKVLNDLVDQLQEDNQNFRNDIRYLTERLDVISKERDALRLEVARLRKKYGLNGENGNGPAL